MLRELLSRLDTEEFYDFGTIHLKTCSLVADRLDLGLVLQYRNAPAPIDEPWTIRCSGVLKHQLRLGEHDTLDLHGQHPLLWEYQQPTVSLYLQGSTGHAEAVLAALHAAHATQTRGFIPFSQFFNPTCPPAALLRGSYGLLAQGPETIIGAYTEILEQLGVPYHVWTRPEQSPPGSRAVPALAPSVLLFSDAYVVAGSFDAVPVR